MPKPLAVVDLTSHVDARQGKATVESIHHHVAPTRGLRVLGPDAAAADLRDAAGIVVTGSPLMLGSPQAQWADALGKALEAAARREVPVLGICFGHQMLGRHFGARLESWPDVKEGLATVTFDGDGPFDGVPPAEMVFTHRDHLTDAGPLRVAATGGLGGIAAWEHPDLPVWGIQGHPEAGARWCRLDGAAAWSAFEPTRLETPAAKQVLRNFGRLLR